MAAPKFLPAKGIVYDVADKIYLWFEIVVRHAGDQWDEREFQKKGIMFVKLQSEAAHRRAVMQIAIRKLLDMDMMTGFDVLTNFDGQQFADCVARERTKWTKWTKSNCDQIEGMLRFVKKAIDPSSSVSAADIHRAMELTRGIAELADPTQKRKDEPTTEQLEKARLLHQNGKLTHKTLIRELRISDVRATKILDIVVGERTSTGRKRKNP